MTDTESEARYRAEFRAEMRRILGPDYRLAETPSAPRPNERGEPSLEVP